MAWIRACGGGNKSAILLSPLSQLPQSTVKWIHNTYFNGIANNGTSTDPANGYLVSVDGSDVATFHYAYGFSVGFVTDCEAEKTYNIKTSGTYAQLYVIYYNGSSFVSSVNSAARDFSFTVPAGIDNVVLIPTGSGVANFTIAITSFTEE